MCNQSRNSPWWLAALLGLLLLFVARTSWAQETSGPVPTPNTQSLEQMPSRGSQDSSAIWTDLMQAWNEFGPIWDALMIQLEQSEIGISELPTYLANTRGQLDSLKTSLAAEIAQRQKAERSRKTWMIVAAVLGGATIAGIVFRY